MAERVGLLPNFPKIPENKGFLTVDLVLCVPMLWPSLSVRMHEWSTHFLCGTPLAQVGVEQLDPIAKH